MPLASLDEFKEHLNITSSSDDAELWTMLDAADAVVRGIVGDVGTGSVTESVRVVGGTAILSRKPTGDVLVNGSPIGGNVDQAAGIITNLGFGYTGLYPYRLTVTYPVGSDFVPAPVKLATLIVGKYMWESQRPASTARTAGAAEPAVDYGYSPGLPERAKVLLEPYSRKSAIA
jgi:hypothetical protein